MPAALYGGDVYYQAQLVIITISASCSLCLPQLLILLTWLHCMQVAKAVHWFFILHQLDLASTAADSELVRKKEGAKMKIIYF